MNYQDKVKLSANTVANVVNPGDNLFGFILGMECESMFDLINTDKDYYDFKEEVQLEIENITGEKHGFMV